jgi:hypothetical protein
MRRVIEYESSMVGSYSDVHWLRTRRSVMDDLPHPPSPQMVMEMGTGGCDPIEAEGVCGGGILGVSDCAAGERVGMTR